MKEEMTQLEFEKANGEIKNRKVFRPDYELINDFREKNMPDLDLEAEVKPNGAITPPRDKKNNEYNF